MRTIATIVLLLAALLLVGCHRGSYTGVYYTGYGSGHQGHHKPYLGHGGHKSYGHSRGNGRGGHHGSHRDPGGRGGRHR